MFANLIIYRIAPQWSATLDQVEQALAKAPFAECGATQEKSAGWIPPRGEAHGALAEAVGHINHLRATGRVWPAGKTPEGAALWGA